MTLDCNKVDVVSLDTGEAAEAASMQARRVFPAVTSSASSMFVFGGGNEDNILSSCKMFDTQSAQ